MRVDAAGKITAVKPGSAKIIARANGTDFTAEVAVTVREVTAAEGLIISPAELALNEGQRGELEVFLAKELAGSEIRWESDNEDAVTVTAAGSVTAVALGEARVSASVTRPDGTVARATATVSVRQADYDNYVIENGVLQGYAGSLSVLNIPIGVREIADQAFAGSSFTSITVPYTVERIGDSAFAEMPQLRRVVIDDGNNPGNNRSRLSAIGKEAFRASVKLPAITLPESLTEIGEGIFQNTRITELHIPAAVTSIPKNAFQGNQELTTLTVGDNVTLIDEYAVAQTPSLRAFKFPSKLEKIAIGGFMGSGIASAELGDATRELGVLAFGGSGIRSLNLNSVETIGSQAFSSTNLREVTIPNSVTKIGDAAFTSMPQLRHVTVGDNVEKDALIGVFATVADSATNPRLESFSVPASVKHYSERSGALYDKTGKHLIAYPMAATTKPHFTVPEGTERIEKYALLGLQANTITLPDSLGYIGERAFGGSALQQLVAPDSLRVIAASAFANSTDLGSVTLPQVVEIGAYAFAYNSALSELQLGTKLETIGKGAFEANISLTEFVTPDSLVTLGDDALINSPHITRVHFGKSLKNLGDNTLTGLPLLREITVTPGNEHFFTDQNVFYERNGATLILKLSLPTNTYREYQVAPGTVAIASQAFRSNRLLERLVLPEGLRELGVGALNDTVALREIVFPDSLQTVEGIYSNNSLKELQFGTQIRSFADSWSMFTDYEHLVVRGGVKGKFEDSYRLTENGAKTLFFGPGMVEIKLDDPIPSVLVVPADLEVLDIAGWRFKDTLRVYAPQGSPGWDVAAAAIKAAGGDPAKQLLPYENLAVTAEITVTDSGISAEAKAVGGVTEIAGSGVDREYRFLAVAPDGTVTVLRDWSGDAAFSGALPDGAALQVETRDATRLTAKSFWLAENSAPVVVEQPTAVNALEGESAQFAVQVVSGSAATVQWQQRQPGGEWRDIPGATAELLTLNSVTAEQSGIEVRAVVKNEHGSTVSAAAQLLIVGKAITPAPAPAPADPSTPAPAPADPAPAPADPAPAPADPAVPGSPTPADPAAPGSGSGSDSSLPPAPPVPPLPADPADAATPGASAGTDPANAAGSVSAPGNSGQTGSAGQANNESSGQQSAGARLAVTGGNSTAAAALYALAALSLAVATVGFVRGRRG